MTRPRPDDNARKAIAEALDETLVVEAAAGTGKTTELVRRILRVLATGRAEMKQIVAVTFTEKAAGELKLRLREALEIERAQATGDPAERLELALETLEDAHVNTIHGFCADILRERPVEARVDPMFTVLTDPQADAIYTRAFRAWLQDALRNPPEVLQRALGRTSAPSFGDIESGPIDRLRRAGRQLAEWRDFPESWRRPPFELHRELDRLITALHKLAAITCEPISTKDNLYFDTDAVRRLSRQIELEQSSGAPDSVGWEGRLIDLLRDRGFSRPRKGSGYKFSKDVTRTEVLLARDTLFADLQQFKRDADADLAAGLQVELAAATARYQALKVSAGALDYADLLARARDLLRSNEDVRHHLQQKFSRIFVDEFQDTDPVQAEILLLLSSRDVRETRSDRIAPVRGKLFIVGDPKQAIYRFRGTDVGTYLRVRDQLEASGGQVLQLTTSYRSLPEIQRFVNAAFAEEMIANEATLQAGYVPLSEWRPAIGELQPSVVALPVPRPYSGRGPLRASARAIEESLPDAIGAFIKWLIEKSGWTVGERGPDGAEHPVPIRPQHIAILFRRFVSFGEDITRRYIDAIEARAIPHLLVGGKAFHGREEVETVRAALAAIEWPDDELSVFATLKGSLFAIDDAHLLEFHHRFRVFHPYRVPRELGGNSGHELALTGEPTAHLVPIADALRLLQDLHRRRNHRPVADTIGRLLAETRAHVGFILRPGGEQALANVLHVAELARQYEAGGGISFRGFIDELRKAAESEAAEAPILEESSDGVRLMTVHKAKGLEFPIVILADPTCRLSRDDASRYLDASRGLCALKIGGWAPRDLLDHEPEEVERDKAEGVRLAYVAATRARDLLVVPALGDSPWEGGWLSPLNRALYPPVASRRDAKRGPRCPAFKSKDSVAVRPNDEMAGPSTVSPGLHRMPGDYSLVWWDPSALDLDAPRLFGVRREDLIVKDVARNVVADGRGVYDRWQLARMDARTAGATPSLSVKTVREWIADDTHELPAGARDVEVVVGRALRRFDFAQRRPELAEGRLADARSGQEGRRIRGAAFGALVHAVLAQAPFDADRELLRAIAATEARALALDDESAQAAAETAHDVFAHELMIRAGRAESRGACRRETPVTCRLPDGTMVEGVVDLAFEEDGVWTVVDYKTDREIESDGEERYRRQIALYATAIATATGTHATGVLLRI